MMQTRQSAFSRFSRKAPLIRLNRWHVQRAKPIAELPAKPPGEKPDDRLTEKEKTMPYRVEVGGKIFEGSNTRSLLRLAVEARRAQRSKNNGQKTGEKMTNDE